MSTEPSSIQKGARKGRVSTGVIVAVIVVVAAVIGATSYFLFFRGTGVETVRIDGSSTVAPITISWAAEFNNPSRQVTVAVSGTGGGFAAFCRGELDLSDASRRIRQSEINACMDDQGPKIENITEFKIGYDGLSIAVDRDNTFLTSLTTQQLCRIFTSNVSTQAPLPCGGTGGKVTQWVELDNTWPATDIKLFSPGTASGTFDFFVEKILTPTKDGPIRDDNIQFSENDNELVDGVASDPNALGYFGAAYVSENVDRIKALGVDGGSGPVSPTESTIRDLSYPLSRPLYIYGAKTHPMGLSLQRAVVKDFLRFGFTARGVEIVGETGYVGLLPSEVTAEAAKIPP